MADRDFTALRRCSQCHSQVRAAKVQTTFYSARNTPSGSLPVPWLNLRGRWLDAVGFRVNTPMTIHVMPGCIVLVTDDGKTENGNDGQSKAALKAAKKDSS